LNTDTKRIALNGSLDGINYQFMDWDELDHETIIRLGKHFGVMDVEEDVRYQFAHEYFDGGFDPVKSYIELKDGSIVGVGNVKIGMMTSDDETITGLVTTSRTFEVYHFVTDVRNITVNGVKYDDYNKRTDKFFD
jgi:hypothetical protein